MMHYEKLFVYNEFQFSINNLIMSIVNQLSASNVTELFSLSEKIIFMEKCSR